MSDLFPYTYIRNSFVKTENATIPIQAKVVQYGQGCFTGMRANWNPRHKKLYIFRIEDHYKRLQESANILGLNLKLSYKKFLEVVTELIKKNKIQEDAYLRPVLYSASIKLAPRFDNPDDDFAIYAQSLKDYFKSPGGINACISSYRRIEDDVISVKAKTTGGYVSSAVAKTEALRNGYDETIFLNREAMVTEASGANLFGVKDNELWTPPLSANILDGITRRTIIELAKKELKITVHEENFDRSMLLNFDELFFSGTAAKISTIRSVDKRLIGNGKIGKITTKLKGLMEKAAIAELPGYEKWCWEVSK